MLYLKSGTLIQPGESGNASGGRVAVKLQMLLVYLQGDPWDDLGIKQTGSGGGVSER